MIYQNAGLINRFSQHFPDAPFPSSEAKFKAWCAANGTDSMKLRTEDPELFSLLAGEAPSALLSSVLNGSFSPVKPDLKANADEVASKRASELLAKGSEATMTERLEMAARHPQAWKIWQDQFGEKAPSADDKRAIDAQRKADEARVRQASLNGFRGKI